MKKVCHVCASEYEDRTKRKVGKTCGLTCAKKLAVQVRKEKGSYQRTEEQNRKLSETTLELYRSGKRKVTVDQAKAWWDSVTPEQLAAWTEKQKQTSIKHYGTDHWTKTKEGKQKLSSIHSGKVLSAEHQRNMCVAAMRSENVHSRSKKGKRHDLGQFFRSTWEANYARCLNYLGIKWQYEMITYKLINPAGQVVTYTPDFVLENGVHVEVKGWLTQTGGEKLRLFQEQFPNIHLLLIRKNEYQLLKTEFQHLTENWENS